MTHPYGQPGPGQPYGAHPPGYDPYTATGQPVYQHAYPAYPAYPQPGYPQAAYPQPGYGYPPPVPMPARHRGWAVGTIFLAGIIFGVIGLVLSDKVESRYRQGDFHGAQRASDQARIYLSVITALAGAFWALVVVAFVLGA